MGLRAASGGLGSTNHEDVWFEVSGKTQMEEDNQKTQATKHEHGSVKTSTYYSNVVSYRQSCSSWSRVSLRSYKQVTTRSQPGLNQVSTRSQPGHVKTNDLGTPLKGVNLIEFILFKVTQIHWFLHDLVVTWLRPGCDLLVGA